MLRYWVSIARLCVPILLMVSSIGCSDSSRGLQTIDGKKPAFVLPQYFVLPQQENNQNSQLIAYIDAEKLVDKEARRYRMFYDADAGSNETKLVMKQFDGRLQLANLETVFGDLSKLSKDSNGNLVGGPIMYKDIFWIVVLSPSGQGVNLVTRGTDGTLSSAFDFDGDRIADIVDIRLGDGRRFSFLTEELGLEVFNLWLHGKNPLCNNDLIKQLGLPDFGCTGNADGSSSGGFGDSDSFFGNFDFFGDLCADYSSPLRRSPVMSIPSHLAGETTEYRANGEHGDEGTYIRTQIYEDQFGDHVDTTKVIMYYNSDGDLVELIVEVVDKDGNGYRIFDVYDPPGTPPLHEEERFQAHLDGHGDYDPFASTPPTYGPPYSYPPDNPYDDLDNPGDPNQEDPNPEDPNAGLAEYCKAREEASRPTGVEAAADTDFQVACSNPTDEPYGGCLNIEFADSRDFEGILEVPEGDQGCGAFTTPGDGGICEPATIQQRVRGMIVDVMSAQLADLGPICPPIVCNPAP